MNAVNTLRNAVMLLRQFTACARPGAPRPCYCMRCETIASMDKALEVAQERDRCKRLGPRE